MINKLKDNTLGVNFNTKVTSNKINEIIDSLNNNQIQGSIQLIGKKIGLNLNTTNDQLITLIKGSQFIITDILLTNSSASITATDGEFWDAPLRAGNILYSSVNGNGEAFSVINSSTDYINSTAINAANTHIQVGFRKFTTTTVGNSIYFSLGIVQGSTATCDIYIYGYILK